MPLLSSVVSRLKLAAFAGALSVAAIAIQGCRYADSERRRGVQGTGYPPPPQQVQVLALGNLRSGRAPSKTEAQLAEFFFGAPPEPGLALVKPVSVAAHGETLLICDSALSAVLQWDIVGRSLTEPRWNDRPQRPVAVRFAPNGDAIVVDVGQSAVFRYAVDGAFVRRYVLGDKAFRPAGVICHRNEIWVSDAANHRVAVFDGSSGTLIRSIGERGPGPTEFGAPLGLAPTPDGRVCVVDTLNDRVQLLDASGKWIRDIGGPGNQVGCFGRPKDVAVGPDGVIFITDAASQRVHAFDSEGRPLIAFGEPESGRDGLSMPAGICICDRCPLPDAELPEEFRPAYFIAVAEQMKDPGIRVYAWRAWDSAGTALTGAAGPIAAESPHWSPAKCKACHTEDQGIPGPVAIAKADAVCLSCHDGRKAKEEPHPIGRPVSAAGLTSPAGWPLHEGRIGCLTCHDIVRHCNKEAVRPAVNPAMLRSFNPGRRIDFCNQCHFTEQFQRLNPHKQIDGQGAVVQSTCTVCHENAPKVPSDGHRDGESRLRAGKSAVCLACHARHWDVSPRGHVDRPVTGDILRNMRARSGDGSPTLPLSDQCVTCFSCHDPHEAGLFPSRSSLATLAGRGVDAGANLRMDFLNLCLHCHAK